MTSSSSKDSQGFVFLVHNTSAYFWDDKKKEAIGDHFLTFITCVWAHKHMHAYTQELKSLPLL